MSAHCHHCHDDEHPPSPDTAAGAARRRVLWAALAINTAMFVVEVGGGLHAGSVALLADALDFFGDAANYALSLAVLSLGLAWRARAALVKAASMAVFGVLVLGRAGWVAWQGGMPEPATMGLIALLALAANLGTAALLYAFRDGDANMRSVWLCTRNDAIGNVAVGVAALGVFGTGSRWPDLAVAVLMAVLALAAALSVLRQARAELAHAPASV
jgi:Co/Zn/Cd efflux system component